MSEDVSAEEADRLYGESPSDPISEDEVERLVEVTVAGSEAAERPGLDKVFAARKWLRDWLWKTDTRDIYDGPIIPEISSLMSLAVASALAAQQEEISQTLGKALGYPWFKDDQKKWDSRPWDEEPLGEGTGDDH